MQSGKRLAKPWRAVVLGVGLCVLLAGLLLTTAGCGSRQDDADETVGTSISGEGESAPLTTGGEVPGATDSEDASGGDVAVASPKPGPLPEAGMPAGDDSTQGQTVTPLPAAGKPSSTADGSSIPTGSVASPTGEPDSGSVSAGKPATGTVPTAPTSGSPDQTPAPASEAGVGKPAPADSTAADGDQQTSTTGQPSTQAPAATSPTGKPAPDGSTTGTQTPSPSDTSTGKPAPASSSSSSAPAGTPAAASPAQPVADPTSEPATGKPATTADPSTTSSEPSAASADAVPTGDVFAQAERALGELQSYRYRATASYGGTLDGETREGSYELEGAVVGSGRYQMEWVDRSSNTRFAVMEIDGQAWMLEDDAWRSVPGSVAEGVAGAVSVYAPEASWGVVVDELLGETVLEGEETINGIRTRHYSSVQLLSEEGETLEARGEVWIAEDGGYPVRFTMDTEVRTADGERAGVQLSVELSDVNGAITIEPPR